VPFIVIIPGMIAGVLVPEITQLKNGGQSPLTYNQALLGLVRDVLPNGLLGIAIAGLLAAFMAGMAANISAFNTVFSYDLWQTYIKKDRPDAYYLRIGRLATVGATVIAIGTALIAAGYSNLMNYLQTLFGFFNAPLFATFIVGMFWKRMTATAGWTGLVSGTLAAVVVAVLSEDSLGSASVGVLPLSGQGASFVAAGAAFVVDVIVSVLVSQVTQPKPVRELAGLVYSETPKEDRTDPDAHRLPWYQSPTKLAGISLVLVIILNVVFR
jgi:SSS family solute:Na+ symporter